MHDTLAQKGANSQEVFSAEKQYEIQRAATDFLTGKAEDVEQISSIRQVKEYLTQMRNIFLKLK